MTDNVTESTNQDETQTQTTPDLSINDLATLKNIIDLASSRGAFRPNEMVPVGQTYNKLVAFLEQVAKHQAAQNPEKEDE